MSDTKPTYKELERRCRAAEARLAVMEAMQPFDRQLRRFMDESPTIARIKAEAELSENEALFREIFHESPIGIELFDHDGILLDVNPACLALFGAPDVEAVKGFRLFEDPNLPDGSRRQLGQGESVRFETVFDFEHVKRLGLYETSRSGKIYIDVRVAALTNGQSRPRGYLAQVQDITESKRAEAALRESEAAYRLLVEHSNDIIWTFDLETMRYTYASPSVDRILGVALETANGATLDDIFEKDAKREILREFGRVVDGKSTDDRVVMEVPHRHRDGGRVWMEISGTAIRDADGRVTGFTGVSRDITDRKRAERALQHSEHRLNEAQRIGLIASYGRNLDTGEGYWSDQCYRLFGYEPGEVEHSFGLYLSHIHEDDRDRVRRILTESYTRLTPNAFDCRYVRRDGEIRHAQHRGEAVIDEDSRNRWLRGTFQDITDRKQAELALWRSEQRLKKAQRMARIASYERDLATGEGYWSDEHYRMFGYEPGEIAHSFELFLSHIHQDDRERARNILINAYERLEPYAYDVRFVRKDGEVRYAHASGEGVMDEDGKRWVRGTFQDITERKRTEEMLRESEQRHRVIFENAPLGMIRFSNDGTILDCNDRFVSLMGSSREKLIGFNTARQSTPVMRETIKRALAGETAVYEDEYTSITGGKTTCLRVVFNPVNPGQPPTGVIATLEDVGDRKRRETALKRSEERFRAVFEQAAAGIAIVDPSGHILDANRKFSEMLGYSKRELTGLNVMEVTHPDDMENELEIINQLFESKENAFNLEKRYVRGDGRTLWANLSSNIIRDESGKPAFAIGVVVDITDRVNSDQALKESEERFRTIFMGSVLGIATADANGCVSSANPAFCRMLGYTEPELIGKHFSDFTLPRYHEFEFQQVERIQRGEKTEYSFEKEYITKSGSVIWVDLTTAVHKNDTGAIQGYIGTIADITERKEAERALVESEERFRKMYEEMPLGIAFVDIETGTIIRANPAVCRMLGYSESELLERTISDITHPEDIQRNVTLVQKLIHEKKGSFSMEKRYLRKDGEIIWGKLTGAMIYGQDGKPRYRIGMVEDITERKEAEAEIEAARRAAEAASRAKSDFISNMSHELRTPLNVILGYGQLLSRDPGLSGTHRDQIVTIRRSGEHLLTLINDILDISRIEADKLRIDPQPTALKALVSNMVEMLSVRAARKRIKLAAWIDPAVPEFVMADDKRLRQILLNLLSNALKFTQEGSVRLSVLSAGDRISFQVTDTGVGIPDDQQDVIFESFVQLGNILNKEEGTGLGLAISQKIARMMGGEITVESTVGAGSAFIFEVALPRTDGGPESEWRSDAPVKLVDRSKTRRRALIVDDKSMDRRVMGDMLWSLGFETETVAEGGNALDRLLAFWPDVVLLDWVLPEGMSGRAVIREIRAMIPKGGPAIIVITGKANHGIEAAAREAGADGCLIKPIRMDDLQKALEAHLPLTWTAEGSDKGLHDERPAELETLPPPPLEDVKAIHDLSRIGDFRGIVGYLERMRESNPDAADFCDAMERPLKQLELKRIKELMEHWIGEANEK